LQLEPSDAELHTGYGDALYAKGDLTRAIGAYQAAQRLKPDGVAIEKALALAPRHLHLHPQVDQDGWVREFSRYDAGWLHLFQSENGGESRRASWDDLNYPARIATLAAAGLPMIQSDNTGHIVATQTLTRASDMGLFIRDMTDLRAQLDDRARLGRLRDNVWARRMEFTFDYHADRLIDFFRQVIAARSA